jgi:hypothetical protein
MTPGRVSRAASWAGAAGPIGFLAAAFVLAALRPRVIASAGWTGWPSSLATGGPAGVPMIAAFVWLGGCYAVFALGALRPANISAIAVIGYLVTAGGDALLAFPTDAGEPVTWHGALHLAGVVVATVGTLIALVGLLVATGGRGTWSPLRPAGAVVAAAAGIGLVAGSQHGWAKVVYVVGITAPAVVVPWCLARDAAAVTTAGPRPPHGEPVT